MDPKEKPYKFIVRLPTVLRNQIADAAKYYRRSINSEIVARLERTFSGRRLEGRPLWYRHPSRGSFARGTENRN